MGAAKKIGAGVGTVWVKPEDGGVEMVAFAEGDKVPAWAAEQMGDHCFTDQEAADEADDEADDSDEDDATSYSDLKKADLKALVDERNADRDDDYKIVVPGNGTVADLISALEADDEADDSDEDDA